MDNSESVQFKEGDRVVVNMTSVGAGDIRGTIKEILPGNGFWYSILLDGDACPREVNRVSLRPLPTPEFKLGARVLCNATGNGDGDAGTVVRVEEYGYTVGDEDNWKYTVWRDDAQEAATYLDSQLTLLEE